MRRWLPLADAVLRAVVRVLPAPPLAQTQRLTTLLPLLPTAAAAADVCHTDRLIADCSSTATCSAGDSRELGCCLQDSPRQGQGPQQEAPLLQSVAASVAEVTRCVCRCDARAAAPLVVFVSKMTTVLVSELAAQDKVCLAQQLTAKLTLNRTSSQSVLEDIDCAAEIAAEVQKSLQPEKEVFLALGRVFSGVLTRDCSASGLYVLGHRHNPFTFSLSPSACASQDSKSSYTYGAAASSSKTAIRVASDHTLGLYMMMGPSVHPVASVPAGNIVGILGLEELLLKSGTLASTWAAHPLTALSFQAQPMLTVAVEPLSHTDLRALEKGLQRLHQFDPVVEVGLDTASGQRTLSCLGELHMEQCLKELSGRFAR